jgi:hypothetical protein
MARQSKGLWLIILLLSADAQNATQNAPQRRERVANRLVDGLLNVTFLLSTDDHPEAADQRFEQFKAEQEQRDRAVDERFEKHGADHEQRDRAVDERFEKHQNDHEQRDRAVDARFEKHGADHEQRDRAVDERFEKHEADQKVTEFETPDFLELFRRVSDLEEQADQEEDSQSGLVAKIQQLEADFAVRLQAVTGGQLDDAKRSVHNAMCCVRVLLIDSRVAPGGGAPELAAALTESTAADSVPAVDQYAMRAFAEAVPAVEQYAPMRAFADAVRIALVENSGLFSTAYLADAQGAQLRPWHGLDCKEKFTGDMFAQDFYETCISDFANDNDTDDTDDTDDEL